MSQEAPPHPDSQAIVLGIEAANEGCGNWATRSSGVRTCQAPSLKMCPRARLPGDLLFNSLRWFHTLFPDEEMWFVQISQQQVVEPGWDPGLPNSRAKACVFHLKAPSSAEWGPGRASASTMVGKSCHLRNSQPPHLYMGPHSEGRQVE